MIRLFEGRFFFIMDLLSTFFLILFIECFCYGEKNGSFLGFIGRVKI